MLARWFGDPTNDMRRAWVEQLSDGRPSDFTIRDYADQAEISVLVLGDTGEGDGSQYALVPGLVSESAGTAFAFVLSDVIYPAGGIDDYENKFYRPYKDYPGPIYAVPGNHDWYDDLTGSASPFVGFAARRRGFQALALASSASSARPSGVTRRRGRRRRSSGCRRCVRRRRSGVVSPAIPRDRGGPRAARRPRYRHHR